MWDLQTGLDLSNDGWMPEKAGVKKTNNRLNNLHVTTNILQVSVGVNLLPWCHSS